MFLLVVLKKINLYNFNQYKVCLMLNIQVIVFLIGYLAIIFEDVVKIHKTATSLIVAALCWGIYVLGCGEPVDTSLHALNVHLSEVSQVVFFLIGAMTIVEMIDVHNGFDLITNRLQNHPKGKMMWLLGLTSFFLSAVLDNLTTTIAMLSIIRKIIEKKEDRWIFGSLVVIAANAGGAWTPIGDVTTTMLWMHGQVTTLSVMTSLFFPCLVSLVVAVLLFQFFFCRGPKELLPEPIPLREKSQNSTMILLLGVGMLIFVPLFKSFTHLPPYMGMLLSLGAVWIFTDLLHHSHTDRDHLKITSIMNRIDLSSVLFFTGILLSIASLETSGVLERLTQNLASYIHNDIIIASTIGIASSIIDNVPLVAACMKMYKLSVYPADSAFWHMVAYCSGTGGSILIIGSAAGVALMGMEKVDFVWYVKRISFIALISYLSGLFTYLIFI